MSRWGVTSLGLLQQPEQGDQIMGERRLHATEVKPGLQGFLDCLLHLEAPHRRNPLRGLQIAAGDGQQGEGISFSHRAAIHGCRPDEPRCCVAAGVAPPACGITEADPSGEGLAGAPAQAIEHSPAVVIGEPLVRHRDQQIDA
jgi:hypothetical protein